MLFFAFVKRRLFWGRRRTSIRATFFFFISGCEKCLSKWFVRSSGLLSS